MRRTKFIIILGGWAAMIAAGGWWQLRYEQTPGEASAMAVWPAGDRPITHRAGRMRVVMGVHPRCPCTRASLAELRELVSRAREDVDVTILLCVPAGAGAAWTESANCDAARAIPGAEVIVDTGGRLAAELGMKTSGHVVVYDGARRLAFSGGITAGRGRVGPSAGGARLRALTDRHEGSAAGAEGEQRAGAVAAPVYGCELVSPGECGVSCGEGVP